MYAFISSIQLQKRLANPEMKSSYLAESIPNRLPDRQALPSSGLEEVLKYSVFNSFRNKVTDGALQILYGSLFQTVGAV